MARKLLETGSSRLRRCRTAVSRTECYSSCSLETFDCNSYIIINNSNNSSNSSSTIYTINSKSLHSSYSTCNSIIRPCNRAFRCSSNSSICFSSR